ncbi:uncharacterized protein [Penaeus vannamei]|uniref:uncharacterized protein n=1 Tax=Penaeus vannamei TaxID=6689 RepID=UPI00387F612A
MEHQQPSVEAYWELATRRVIIRRCRQLEDDPIFVPNDVNSMQNRMGWTSHLAAAFLPDFLCPSTFSASSKFGEPTPLSRPDVRHPTNQKQAPGSRRAVTEYKDVLRRQQKQTPDLNGRRNSHRTGGHPPPSALGARGLSQGSHLYLSNKLLKQDPFHSPPTSTPPQLLR